jgi:hypothetical protein
MGCANQRDETVREKRMETNNGAFAEDDDGLALLEVELAALSNNLAELKSSLVELLETMQMQLALELGAPQAGDPAVRWN